VSALIHIGYHKTGTTWLQERFFGRDPIFRVIATHPAIDAAIVRPNSLDFDPAKALSDLGAGSNAAKASTGIPVMSSEILSGNPFTGARESHVIAHRLRAMFPDARVLITVRNQMAMLSSFYKQYVRFGGRLGHRDFFLAKPEIEYYGFEARHLQYDRLIDLYAGLFPKGNVSVMLYEDFSRGPAAFCQQIADFANGGPAKIQPVDSRPRGVSASAQILPVLRQINRFRAGPLNATPCLSLGWLSYKAYRAVEKLDVQSQARWGRRSDGSLGEFIRERFADSYRSSNAKLAALLKRDLAPLAYPV